MSTSLDVKNFSIDKAGWQKVKFGDVVFEPKESVKNPLDEGVQHVVGLEHIDSEDMHLRRSSSIDEETTFTKKFSKGDVLFGRRRAYLKKAARAEFEGICSGDITVMRTSDRLLPELLPFIVNNEKFFDYAITHSAGGLSPRVKFKDLGNYRFLLPPIDQQAELAEFLWGMESLIAGEAGLVKKNKTLLKSFVEDTIHGRYLNEGDIEDSKIGKIPSGWTVVALDNVVKVTDGAHHTPTYTEEGVPFLRVTDVQSPEVNFEKIKYISKEEHMELIKRCKPENGDILYSKNGTIGISKIITWDWEFSTFVSLALLKILDRETLNVNYLKLLLDSLHIKKEIHRRAKQGTITNLHLEEIRLFRIPLPPLDKQLEIAEKVTLINDAVASAEAKYKASKELLKTILLKVF